MFSPGQTYVALSRLTSLDGLYLTRPLRPSDIIVDENVKRFMNIEVVPPVANLAGLDASGLNAAGPGQSQP